MNDKKLGADKAKRRKIDQIIVHCSATPEGRDVSAADIARWHIKERGFRSIGYHYVVRLDGTVEPGRPENEEGAHCRGHNMRSIGVCYVGGVDCLMRPKDTRTPQQKEALRQLLASLLKRYPKARVYGHCDFAAKACPCFDVADLLPGYSPLLPF